MIDPIKPNKSLMKKPNFKKERLDDGSIKVFFYDVDTFNIDIGNINDSEIDDIMRRMQQTFMVPSYIGGGEQMMYNATTTMMLPSPRKKKSIITKLKHFFQNIYIKWKHVG